MKLLEKLCLSWPIVLGILVASIFVIAVTYGIYRKTSSDQHVTAVFEKWEVGQAKNLKMVAKRGDKTFYSEDARIIMKYLAHPDKPIEGVLYNDGEIRTD